MLKFTVRGGTLSVLGQDGVSTRFVECPFKDQKCGIQCALFEVQDDPNGDARKEIAVQYCGSETRKIKLS